MEEIRLTRREAIASLVGVPALASLVSSLAACSRKDVKALAFPGEIVGPDATLGHLLRTGDLLARPAVRTERVGTAIVGGGVSGLSAAWRLARAGDTDFRVYELEREEGGTARSGGNGVSLFPWGAHYVPVPAFPNPALEAVLEEIGALTGRDAHGAPQWAEEMLCREPEERLFYGGRWHAGLFPYEGASRDDLAQVARYKATMDAFAARKDAKGRRGFGIPTRRSAVEPDLLALDRMTMKEWLDANRFTSKRLRWMVEYGCRDDFGTNLGGISAWAGIHYDAARLPGTNDDEDPSDFLTWPEGNGRLVHHLAKSAAGRIDPRALVFDVVPATKPGATVTLRYLDAKSGEVVAVEARDVVLAIPKYAARHVLAPWRAEPPAFLASLSYAPWVVANVTLTNRPKEPGTPLAWDNVIYDSRSLGYVVATHQAYGDYGPTVLTWYMPLTDEEPVKARQKLLAAEWKDLAAAVLADLSRAHPDLPDLVARIDVARWGHAMLRPTPGFLGNPVRGLAPIGGVHFAHADSAGLPLFEEAQDTGVRAAEAILAARGLSSPALAAD